MLALITVLVVLALLTALLGFGATDSDLAKGAFAIAVLGIGYALALSRRVELMKPLRPRREEREEAATRERGAAPHP